jgi:hypothetical protein
MKRMKKAVIAISILILMFTVGTAIAGPMSYHDEKSDTYWVDSSGSTTPKLWFSFTFLITQPEGHTVLAFSSMMTMLQA